MERAHEQLLAIAVPADAIEILDELTLSSRTR